MTKQEKHKLLIGAVRALDVLSKAVFLDRDISPREYLLNRHWMARDIKRIADQLLELSKDFKDWDDAEFEEWWRKRELT